jgi:two-component system cell cycle sensor histidine kinase/response regulator CckA
MTDRGTILVVDDDAVSLRQLTRLLSAEGYDVRAANCGPLALASAAEARPDLILLDIEMPDMNGFETCRRLKAPGEESAYIPVIFISAGHDAEDRVEGLRSGAVDCINKPYWREELLVRVQTHVELGRLRTRLERQVAERTTELSRVNERLLVELAERRRAEQALRESEMRFRNLANRAPVGIWVTGPDRGATFYNKRALLFTGHRMNQLIQRGWADIVHPDDLAGAYAKYIPAVTARRSFRIECRVRRANGKYRWVLSTGIPISIRGAYGGHIGTSIDITDLKRSHNEMLAAQKLESLGVMAAGIAHDFNNLLGGILAESDLALSELPPEWPARENVEHINAVAGRASEIVDLLMACAGGRDVTFEAVDLSSLVQEMLELLRGSLTTGNALDIRLESTLPAVRANPSQIRQVVLNLLKNGSEALQNRQGTITVTTGCVRIGRPFDELPGDLPDGEYARLVVSDTGCGMSPEVRSKVFDPFYTTKFTGRGLGLAVVQGIIRSHGGAINVISTPDKGSTFEVLLPFARQRSRELPMSRPKITERHCLGTVLIVEDEDTLRLAVARVLDKEGFHVLTAETGEVAVNLFLAHAKTIDLVLLDLNLPCKSGAEVLAEVRSIRPEAKVMITTGYDPQIASASYAWASWPPEDFIRKPYRLSELVKKIRSLLIPPHSRSGAAA